MMPETNLNATAMRRQIARGAASEAIKALFAVYWADSFNANLLQSRVADLIFLFTKNALILKTPDSYPETSSDGEGSTSNPAPEISEGEV